MYTNKQEFLAIAKTVEQLENYVDRHNLHAVDIFKFELGTDTVSSITFYNNYIKIID